MKIHVKTSVAFAIALFVAVACRAQNTNVVFGYDVNGNRTGRTLMVKKTGGEENKSLDTIIPKSSIPEAIYDFESESITVYPNPTHDKLTISLHGLGDGCAKVCILASNGTILFQHELPEGIHNTDLSELPPGLYLLQLTTTDTTQTWKIIKN